MNNNAKKNKEAWEYRSYEHAEKNIGKPKEQAEYIAKDPLAVLKKHGKYFMDVKGLSIANPCGSYGRRALALTLLGAEVTVFDISEENKRYAMALSECADISLGYEVCDLYDVDMTLYKEHFDMLYLEGGILHYFHDLDKLMSVLYQMLNGSGRIVLNDFHPFRKVMPINFFDDSVGDYFDSDSHEGKVAYENLLDGEDFPKCSLRYYNISEILNSMIKAGFVIREFNEEPSWTDDKLPGEITIYAKK